MDGYIKIYRKIENNWIWTNPNYFHAWIYILLRANWKDTEVLIGGSIITCKRGEFITSIQSFSKSTFLTFQQVRTFWNLLESNMMIVRKSTNNLTKIIVCKYEDYQDLQQTNNKRITNEQQTNNKRITTEEEDKEDEEEEKNKNIYVDFDKFWNEYHQITGRAKTDKDAAFKYWKRLTGKERDLALEKIKLYFKSLRDPKYCKKARTYLSDKNFNDEFEYEKKKRPKSSFYPHKVNIPNE